MNKVDKILTKFLIFALPFVLIILCWAAISDPNKMSASSGLTRIAWDALGWTFMIWIFVSFYIVVKMVIQKTFRDQILGKAAGIKERDERESIIVGEAAKVSFLSTMAFIILLLFFSIFTITLARQTNSQEIDKKKSSLTIQMNFPLLVEENKHVEIQNNDIEIFTYSGVPLSKSILLLLILLWQVGSYKYIIYKENLD
jgi:hypothetical protein